MITANSRKFSSCAGISSCWRVAGSKGNRLAWLLYIAAFTILYV
ncbi:hypothetical protein T11_8109 [Trichinella zimbabwensis]|uniref:Uncharacterized protein n=1 Tax=Trichinella zimbabwensis TaxID=268475 RepID=A0A0V1G8S4_9BILA|nr:hypothetical protein T11_8109 [Trichinella zimbabwensis]